MEPKDAPGVVISGTYEIGDDRLDYRDEPAVVRAHFPQFGIVITEAVPEIKFGLGPTSYP